MTDFQPGSGGKLLLWTGPPGTGKTYALRALAWEWRSWCSFHYITDPESVFGDTRYLMTVQTSPGVQKKWKLLILEDTGELLAADAKLRTGQGLSRLLNLVDGLIGQGFPTLVLVTSNEEMGTLHPAISRPGRCASHIEFDPLNAAEASRWLAAHGRESSSRGSRTLAELYAISGGQEDAGPYQRAVGF